MLKFVFSPPMLRLQAVLVLASLLFMVTFPLIGFHAAWLPPAFLLAMMIAYAAIARRIWLAERKRRWTAKNDDPPPLDFGT